MSSEHDSLIPMSHTLAARLLRATGVRAADCYQCAKCTAGCPVQDEMDHAPSEVMRMVQMELPAYENKALGSLGIWMCLGCDTCATRCPKCVNLPAAMDFLRQEAMQRNVVHKEARDIVAFHRAFLSSIESHGRAWELGLIVDYKLQSGHLFQDATVAPAMLLKGKLGLFPHRVDNPGSIAAMFARAKASGAKKGSEP